MTNTLLIENRECGACTVCCVNLTINDPELQKLPGVKCKNMVKTGGCKIYENRPKTCRDWYCMWRFIPGLSDEWRPDLKGIVIKRVFDDIPAGYEDKIALEFEIIGSKKVIHDTEFINLLRDYINKGFPCFISYGKPRTATTMVFLNDILLGPFESHNLDLVCEKITEAFKICLKKPKDKIMIRDGEIIITPARKK